MLIGQLSLLTLFLAYCMNRLVGFKSAYFNCQKSFYHHMPIHFGLVPPIISSSIIIGLYNLLNHDIDVGLYLCLQPAFGQQCSSCRRDYVKPFDWQPLRCSKCGPQCRCKKKDTHSSDLCERCHSEDPCPDETFKEAKHDKPRRPRRNKNNREPYRVYGWFECSRCKNKWQSAYTWVRLSLRGNEIVSIGYVIGYMGLFFTG